MIFTHRGYIQVKQFNEQQTAWQFALTQMLNSFPTLSVMGVAAY